MKVLRYMLKSWCNLWATDLAPLTSLAPDGWKNKIEAEHKEWEEVQSKSFIEAPPPTRKISPLDHKKLKAISDLAKRLR